MLEKQARRQKWQSDTTEIYFRLESIARRAGDDRSPELIWRQTSKGRFPESEARTIEVGFSSDDRWAPPIRTHSIHGPPRQRGGNFGAQRWKASIKVAQSHSSEGAGRAALRATDLRHGAAMVVT